LPALASREITQQVVPPRRRQLPARRQNFGGLMDRGSIAERHAQKRPRVNCPATFQQCEEEVRPKAYAGMSDCPDFIASQDETLTE
jgi:hypothetical protein